MSAAWIGFFGSVVVGVLSLIGAYVSNSKAQAVTDTKIEELTREVREHNNFARRMPVLEERVETLGKQIEKLEKKGA